MSGGSLVLQWTPFLVPMVLVMYVFKPPPLPPRHGMGGEGKTVSNGAECVCVFFAPYDNFGISKSRSTVLIFNREILRVS